MHLVPWKKTPLPATPASSFQQELNRLFNQFFGDFGLDEPVSFPALSIKEDARHITVTAEVPGLEAPDIDVSAEGNLLTLRGEKREEKKEDGEDFHRSERSYGAFLRRVVLPTAVDIAHAEATLHKGVLTLKLPKQADGPARKIQVQAR